MKNKYKLASLLAGMMGMMSVNSNAQVYCSAAAVSTADDEIFNVTLGTLNNTSNCAQTGGPGSILNRYADYTNASPAVAAPVCIVGQNYPMSITVGQCGGYPYSGYVRVWIDYNANGVWTDPGELVFTSASTQFQLAGTVVNVPGGVTIPIAATPGLTRMRIIAQESGIPATPCSSPTWGEVEDYSVFIGSGTPCSGIPAANSVVNTTAAICPNSSTGLSLANTYTLGGITYQWQSSTLSPVGPWNSIPNATNASVPSPSLPVLTYFQAIITCTNGNGSVTATAGTVNVQNTTTNTVPYYENFEGITNTDQLPNCSWQASSLPGTCHTYTIPQTQGRYANSGTKYASFGPYNNTGSYFFASNGIWMEPGITYSASMWYTTDYYGYTSWNLRMYLGPNQSTVNANIIAQSLPASSPAYKSLSNTFTVATAGLYYVLINGQTNGSCCSYWLSWDDLRIEAPCQLNMPQVMATSNSQTICAGQAVNITATGADTYAWNNGANTSGDFCFSKY